MNYDRFKTRIWIPSQNKMIYSTEDEKYGYNDFDYVGVDISIPDGELNHFSFVSADSDPYCAIPMQCWGLKDINNKIAYEADIVKFWLKHKNKFIFGIIESDTCDNNLWIKSLGSYPFTNIYIEDCEIIDNKWENPELLKEKAK